VITCPALSETDNRLVSYDTSSPYEYGTVATYDCAPGFSLSSDEVDQRTCLGGEDSSLGTWNGTEPTCQGE